MPVELAAIETELGLIDWRNRQLEAITEQLETAFPELLDRISRHVEGMSLLAVGRAHISVAALARELIQPWAEKQFKDSSEHARESLGQVLAEIPHDNQWKDHLTSALPAVGGVGLVAASAAGIPTVVAFATPTLLSIAIPFVALNPVTLAVGGAALAVISLGGASAIHHATGKTRKHLVNRLQLHALIAVFGVGLPPGARCVLNDLQAFILAAGKTAMMEAT